MALSELITSRTAVGDSADVILASGESCTLILVEAGGSVNGQDYVVAAVHVKAGPAAYVRINNSESQLSARNPVAQVSGPMVFQVRKVATTGAVQIMMER
jgi:hypothetical protein